MSRPWICEECKWYRREEYDDELIQWCKLDASKDIKYDSLVCDEYERWRSDSENSRTVK